MRKPLRVIQHADHPEMIESALRPGCINCMERERNRAAGTVEGCDFGSPKIIGFYRPTPLHRFHNQRRKLRDPRANVETTATPLQVSSSITRPPDSRDADKDLASRARTPPRLHSNRLARVRHSRDVHRPRSPIGGSREPACMRFVFMVVLQRSASRLRSPSRRRWKEIRDSTCPRYPSHDDNADSGSSPYRSTPRQDSQRPRTRHGRFGGYEVWPLLVPAPLTTGS